jgi:nucleoside-diphosphate kinase
MGAELESMATTLVIIKPEAVQRGLIGEIIKRLERRGLKIVAMKMMQISGELAAKHYGIHFGKPFYEGLVEHITSSPVVVLAVEGRAVIEVVRTTMGVTDPAQAAPGTIRGDLGLEIGRNLIHGSDGPETAAFEMGLFFAPEEILAWNRDADPWIQD